MSKYGYLQVTVADVDLIEVDDLIRMQGDIYNAVTMNQTTIALTLKPQLEALLSKAIDADTKLVATMNEYIKNKAFIKVETDVDNGSTTNPIKCTMINNDIFMTDVATGTSIKILSIPKIEENTPADYISKKKMECINFMLSAPVVLSLTEMTSTTLK